MNWRLLIRTIPLFILTGICLYNWIVFLRGIYIPNVSHYLGLACLIVNLVFIFKHRRIATLITGIILFFSGFNLLEFTTATRSSGLSFGSGGTQISTPGISLWAMGLLILYLILNIDFLIKWYVDYKDFKTKSKGVNR